MPIILQEEIEKIKNIGGEARGAALQTDARYVLEKEGEEGLKKAEDQIRSLGYKISYKQVKATDWYPISLRLASLLVIKNVFDWPDSEIRKMGNTAPKFSFIVKFLFKVFSFLDKFVKQIPKFWEEHFTIGEIKVKEFDEKNKELIISVENVKFHPLFCLYLEGYCERILQFVVSDPVCRETKCVFKGDSCHEYTFTWK